MKNDIALLWLSTPSARTAVTLDLNATAAGPSAPWAFGKAIIALGAHSAVRFAGQRTARQCVVGRHLTRGGAPCFDPHPGYGSIIPNTGAENDTALSIPTVLYVRGRRSQPARARCPG